MRFLQHACTKAAPKTMTITLLVLCLISSYLVQSLAFQPPQQPNRPSHRTKTTASAAHQSNDDDPSNESKPPLPKTQSQSARSAELRRRQSRIAEGFATPGISSAIPGATDYAVEPSATEREYYASLGIDPLTISAGVVAGTAGESYGQVDIRDIERMDEMEKEKQIALHTTLGLTHLRSLRLKAAYRSFEYVYKLHPEAYLWQLGLLQYYFGEYSAGQKTCEENAARYEKRFGAMGEVASEERIWRDACLLKGRGNKKKTKKVKKEETEERSSEEEERLEMKNIECERRKVIRLARQLFSASVHNNPSQLAMTRVQLQSMCQDNDDDEATSSTNTLQKKLIDPKMYKLHSAFYLGLHYDALGQVEESKKYIKMALKRCSNGGNSQDITFLLPVIHMTVRDWYDDDNFEVEDEDGTDEQEALIEQLLMEGAVELSLSNNDTNDDSIATQDEVKVGIRESIKHLRIVDLRQELKKRKLKVAGSKRELQDRLVNDIALEMKGR